MWSGARESRFLALVLPCAQCVALENSPSSAAQQLFLLSGGEVTPALLKGQTAAGINSGVSLMRITFCTSGSEERH